VCQQTAFCGGDGKWRHNDLKPWRCGQCGALHYNRQEFLDSQMVPYKWCPDCGGMMRLDHEPVVAVQGGLL
jgi:ribosomal protein S27AE